MINHDYTSKKQWTRTRAFMTSSDNKRPRVLIRSVHWANDSGWLPGDEFKIFMIK